jgi:hypothetical protein
MKTTRQFREDLKEEVLVSHRLGFEWEGCITVGGDCVSEVILKLLDHIEDLEIEVVRLEQKAGIRIKGEDVKK